MNGNAKTGISTHQTIFHFNNKYSVQPQNNEVLESLIKFAQKWKNSTGALCSLEMHFNALKKVLKV